MSKQPSESNTFVVSEFERYGIMTGNYIYHTAGSVMISDRCIKQEPPSIYSAVMGSFELVN